MSNSPQNWKRFVEKLCQALEKTVFNGKYSANQGHTALVTDVSKAIQKFISLPPNKNKLHIVSDAIYAFGFSFPTDICLQTTQGETVVAIEVKRGRPGDIKTGIGQTIAYRAKYKYAILFYLNQNKGVPTTKTQYSDKIKKDLWDNYGIRLILRFVGTPSKTLASIAPSS